MEGWTGFGRERICDGQNLHRVALCTLVSCVILRQKKEEKSTLLEVFKMCDCVMQRII